MLAGCAVAPYKRPSVETGLQERREIYEQKKVELSNWTWVQVGGRPVVHFPKDYAGSLADYMEASGDPTSAARARMASPYSWTGLAIGLGCLTAGILSNGDNKTVQPSLLAWGLGGIGLEFICIVWGRQKHVRPAADSFDAYLLKDLGLSEPSRQP
jgi:hypothetical protein